MPSGWRFVVLLGAFMVAGCTQLPIDGPTSRDIAAGAAASLTAPRGALVSDYALVDITERILDCIDEVGPGSFFRTFGAGDSPAPVIRIGVGDVVQVAVFESAAGGLFIPAEAGVRPGNFVTFPAQTVSRSGTISIPYAGQIRAAGRTPSEIERDIESKIANRAIEPQVIVTLVDQNSTTVSIFGDTLVGANKFPIRHSGERILDIIARAGGLKFPAYESFVTLQRNKQRATVYLPVLINNPEENIFVAPGDTIYVYREQQKFVALGALTVTSSGSTSISISAGGGSGGAVSGQITFDQERLSLNEAVAKAGGLQDLRANPEQVFLYRMEYRETLERAGVKLANFPPEQRFIPTVYRANFRDPSSFFAAQKFPMRHKDTIYVANADAVEVEKFLTYLRTVTSTVSGVASDLRLTRDSLR
jgi:polysaccharide export outer membrane protein